MAVDEARTQIRRPAIADSDARLEAENRILFGKGPFSESKPHGLFGLEPIPAVSGSAHRQGQLHWFASSVQVLASVA